MSILLADIDATCAALGYSDGTKYQAEPDALQGLKHLIWILRRDLDNHEYRRHLGRAKVLQTDLVPMLPDYMDDDEFADVLIRLLVILTNPTLLLFRDGAPKDGHLRKVFMELIEILQGYKSAFTVDRTWAALSLKLQKGLEIDWALRSEEQGFLIERILVLIRNVLQVPANPEAECRADNDASLHDQVIWALHQSGVLDLVLYVISSPDENQYHLHGLEILCLLFREQTAESLADASLQRSASEKQRDEQELIAARRREKQKLVARPPPGRHSRFGGTYVIQNFKSVSDKDAICHQSLERAVAIDFDREKERQKKSFRIIKEESQNVRRSAFSVRLCLREYCIEVLRSAYNTLVRQVRRVLERNSGSTSHDDSYLLWAVRFFMEFNRLSGLQMHLVSESLSVQCFHWVLTRIQHDTDMMATDKKQTRLWSKRLHVALQTFRELLLSLVALQKLQDEKAGALFDMLLNNVCYVLEYRETILHLLMSYNESHSTRTYLRDVIETANVFVKMMERFCKDSVVVQDKRRKKKSAAARRKGSKKSSLDKDTQVTEDELENKWVGLSSQIGEVLSNELNLPEEDQPIPFDAASEKNIDDQKEDCMVRIHKLLREEKLEHAIALMRAAREVWPENDCFGSITAAPEDELLLLREIFLHNIGSVQSHFNSLDIQLRRFWEIEEGLEDRKLTSEEEKCQQHFKQTFNRRKDGRYEVRLPFKEGHRPSLGNSRQAAMARFFQIERRLLSNKKLQEAYTDCISEYATLGHMSEVSSNVHLASGEHYFLPHHAVFKETSTTTKLRVVFDASCKTSNGKSLNDHLMVGPRLQADIIDLIAKWRKFKVAFSADISMMYRQIRIAKEDTPYQMILWRATTRAPLKTYALNTVTFGTSAAPYLAVRTLQQLATDVETSHPHVTKALMEGFYVDDLIYGADNEENAITLQRDVLGILKAAGFPLRKWASNSTKVLEQVSVSEREVNLPLQFDSPDAIKMLGIQWHPANDTFKFQINLPATKTFTKRSVLADISRLFDPLGWIAPCILKAKLILQQLWRDELSWDAPIPQEIQKIWIDLRSGLKGLQEIQIPRWIEYEDNAHVQLHGFSDASERAYAAVIYARVIKNGKEHTHILASKTRVAPLKQISLPRLELCGACNLKTWKQSHGQTP